MKCTLNRNEIEEIEMDLTGTCNLRCPICTRNFVHAKDMITKNIRSLDEIIRQLDTFSGLNRFFIAGAVSEPTLHPQFFEFIKYLNKRKITYELFTNGSTHDPEWWKTLGSLVPSSCMTCFTICGSTQEMHSRYRIGSNLQDILDNASSYRSNLRKNDWIQTIRFQYNQEDLKSNAMHSIIDQFSHHMQVDSEGMRRLNDKTVECLPGIAPVKRRDDAIKYIFTKYILSDQPANIECKSFMQKKVYIDQFGNVAPCYINAEYEKNVFDNDAVEFDYSDIFNCKYKDCRLCSSSVNDMIRRMNLEFIC